MSSEVMFEIPNCICFKKYQPNLKLIQDTPSINFFWPVNIFIFPSKYHQLS